MRSTEILGLHVDSFLKKDLLSLIEKRISNNKTFIVTANPEGVMLSAKNSKFKKAVNKADIVTADGTGLIWASHVLNRKFRNTFLKFLIIPSYTIFSLFVFSITKKPFQKIIPERITGSDSFWDILKIANKKDKTIFLLGGFNGVSDRVAKKVKNKFPNLRIVGISEGNPKDKNLVSDINKSDADILFIAWGQPKQEVWINDNLSKLNVRLAVGVGGTYDFIAGAKKRAPKVFRRVGLEWFWRLFIEPKRIKRIFTAVPKFVYAVCREKIKNPERQYIINGN